MYISVRFMGVRQVDETQDLEAILKNSMASLGSRVKQICLYIEDVNGPRGGVDKQCRCVLHLKRLPPVVIRDHDDDIRALVHRVADRAAHALSRKVDRVANRTVQGLGKIEHRQSEKADTNERD